MSSDRVDRTLSKDPKDVAVLSDDGAYHEITGRDPLVADCGITHEDPDFETETGAITAGHERCGRCDFDEPLAVYVLGSKEFHRPAERGGAGRTACGGAEGADHREDVVRRGVACLVFNGIDACPGCWDISGGAVAVPEDD